MIDFNDPSFDLEAYMAPFAARLAADLAKAARDSKKF